MSDNTFWICFWTLAAVTFVIVFVLLAIFSQYNNELYYKAQSECVSSGGSFVPTRGANMCLRK